MTSQGGVSGTRGTSFRISYFVVRISYLVVRISSLVKEMNEKIKNFRDLNVWKKGMEIVEEVYKATQKFPSYELYGLTTQMRRAAISIPSNIAEGFARKHNKEYKQFLYVVLGSSSELETQIEISLRLGFIVDEKLDVLLEKIDHANRMTMNLIKCL